MTESNKCLFRSNYLQVPYKKAVPKLSTFGSFLRLKIAVENNLCECLHIVTEASVSVIRYAFPS